MYPLSEEEVVPYLKNKVSIAVDNGQSVVLSGSKTQVDALKTRLEKDNILVHDILEGPAGHTTEMDSIREEYEKAFSDVKLNVPTIPMVSNVTGGWCSEEFTSPKYWVRHLAEKVDFFKGLKGACQKVSQCYILGTRGR